MLSTVIEHLVKGEIMQMKDSWEEASRDLLSAMSASLCCSGGLSVWSSCVPSLGYSKAMASMDHYMKKTFYKTG